MTAIVSLSLSIMFCLDRRLLIWSALYWSVAELALGFVPERKASMPRLGLNLAESGESRRRKVARMAVYAWIQVPELAGRVLAPKPGETQGTDSG